MILFSQTLEPKIEPSSRASMVEAIAKPFGTVKQQDDGLFRINPHEGDEQQEHAPA